MNNLRTPLEKAIPSILSTYYATGDPVPTRPIIELKGKRFKIVDFNYDTTPVGHTLALVTDNNDVAITVAFPFETCQRHFNSHGKPSFRDTKYRIFEINCCQLSFYHKETLKFAKQDEEITESLPIDSFKIMLIIHDFKFLTISTNHSSPAIQYIDDTRWFINIFQELTLKREILVKRRYSLKQKCEDIIGRTMDGLSGDIKSLKRDFSTDPKILEDLQYDCHGLEALFKYIPIIQARTNSYFELKPKPRVDITNEDQVINICLQGSKGIDSLIKLSPMLNSASRSADNIYPHPPTVLYYKVKPTLDTNRALKDYADNLFDDDSDEQSEEDVDSISETTQTENDIRSTVEIDDIVAGGKKSFQVDEPQNPTPAPVVVQSTYASKIKTITKINTVVPPILMPTFDDSDDDEYDDEYDEVSVDSKNNEGNEDEKDSTDSVGKSNDDTENNNGNQLATSDFNKGILENNNSNKEATDLSTITEIDSIPDKEAIISSVTTGVSFSSNIDVNHVDFTGSIPLPSRDAQGFDSVAENKDNEESIFDAQVSIDPDSELLSQRNKKRKHVSTGDGGLLSSDVSRRKIWINQVGQSNILPDSLDCLAPGIKEDSQSFHTHSLLSQNLFNVEDDRIISKMNVPNNVALSTVKNVIHLPVSLPNLGAASQGSASVTSSKTSVLERTVEATNVSTQLALDSDPINTNVASPVHSSPTSTFWPLMGNKSKELKEAGSVPESRDKAVQTSTQPSPGIKALSQSWFSRFLGERKK